MSRANRLLTVKSNIEEVMKQVIAKKGSDPIFNILYQNLVNVYSFILAEWTAEEQEESQPHAQPTILGLCASCCRGCVFNGVRQGRDNCSDYVGFAPKQQAGAQKR